ncbi:MAG: hypothetical protein ACOH2F_03605 [Cellulomonas sp.]
MSDPWTAPAARTNDYPASPQGFEALRAAIVQLQTQVREMRSSLLANTGLSVNPQGMVVDSSMTVAGNLDVTGHAAITGTLSLPAGIIDNDALANPVAVAGNSAVVNDATIGSAWTNVLTTTIPAPEWAGKALISATGSATSTAQGGAALIQARIGIDGAYSDLFEWVAQLSGDQIICSPISFRDYDPGATVTVTLDARRTAGASTTVLGRLVATGTFLR